MLFGSINGQNSIAAANGTDSLAGTDTDDGTGSPDEITLSTLLKPSDCTAERSLLARPPLKRKHGFYWLPPPVLSSWYSLHPARTSEIIKKQRLVDSWRLDGLGAEGYVKKIVAHYNKGRMLPGMADLYFLSAPVARNTAGQRCAGASAAASCELGYSCVPRRQLR